MHAAKAGTDSVELGKWMERLAKARTIAMQAQKLTGAESRKRRDVGAVKLDVDVGDEVWVMFPNVREGRSRKLAFRMHGTYVLREWLHGEKRVALLSHVDDEHDVIMAHVDRIVRKKEVSKDLRDQWKPIKMELLKDKAKKRVNWAQQMQTPSMAGRLQRAPAGEEEEFDVDGAFQIEKILDHNVDKDGFLQFKVRFVGFGPKDDLWYEEADLAAMEPTMVADYKLESAKKVEGLGVGQKRGRGRPKAKRKTASTVGKAPKQEQVEAMAVRNENVEENSNSEVSTKTAVRGNGQEKPR